MLSNNRALRGKALPLIAGRRMYCCLAGGFVNFEKCCRMDSTVFGNWRASRGVFLGVNLDLAGLPAEITACDIMSSSGLVSNGLVSKDVVRLQDVDRASRLNDSRREYADTLT